MPNAGTNLFPFATCLQTVREKFRNHLELWTQYNVDLSKLDVGKTRNATVDREESDANGIDPVASQNLFAIAPPNFGAFFLTAHPRISCSMKVRVASPDFYLPFCRSRFSLGCRKSLRIRFQYCPFQPVTH